MGFYLVWRLFWYFTNYEVVFNFTLSPSSCLRKGIEKGSSLSVLPTPTSLSLGETHPLGPMICKVPAFMQGTENMGTISGGGI